VKIVLASASPRRAELLRQLGLTFTIHAPYGGDDPEDVAPAGPAPGQDPLAAAQDTARRLAAAKAEIASRTHPDAVVIAADTIVVAGDRFLGKPRHAGDARDMLRSISGRRHHVVTGVAVVHGRKNLSLADSAVTAVWFRELGDDEIARYVETRESLDKAGAYGIQGKGAVFVERLEGDYFNVVGLPLLTLASMLERAGVRVF